MKAKAKIKIYIEGGGSGHLQDTLFRQGWTAFFKAAGLGGKMPKVIRGQGRQRTFELFELAIANPRSGELPLLLVDSEAPVQKDHSPWKHLKARDNWDQPDGAKEDHVYLMVQVMETWFLADREMLRRYFGNHFRENVLRDWVSLEDLPKSQVFEILERATAACKTPYSKGKVSFELLEKLNPAAVEAACPHCARLLEYLREPS